MFKYLPLNFLLMVMISNSSYAVDEFDRILTKKTDRSIMAATSLLITPTMSFSNIPRALSKKRAANLTRSSKAIDCKPFVQYKDYEPSVSDKDTDTDIDLKPSISYKDYKPSVSHKDYKPSVSHKDYKPLVSNKDTGIDFKPSTSSTNSMVNEGKINNYIRSVLDMDYKPTTQDMTYELYYKPSIIKGLRLFDSNF